MWDTRNSYFNLWIGKTQVEDKYWKDLPRWDSFDKIAHNWISRVLDSGVYSDLLVLGYCLVAMAIAAAYGDNGVFTWRCRELVGS